MEQVPPVTRSRPSVAIPRGPLFTAGGFARYGPRFAAEPKPAVVAKVVNAGSIGVVGVAARRRRQPGFPGPRALIVEGPLADPGEEHHVVRIRRAGEDHDGVTIGRLL